MSEVTKSPAVQRIEALLDDNSFVELGALVTSRNTDFNLNAKETPSDGVVIGHGLIDGNLVFVYSQDASVLNGTIGEMHARKIVSIYQKAVKMGAPVIGFIDCAGVRLQESVDALYGMGEIYQASVKASGVIPQITAIFGQCGGGLSVLPAMSDFTFMSSQASLFFNSPDTLLHNAKDKLDTSAAKFQYEQTGTVDFVGSEEEVTEKIRQLVLMLPGNNLSEGAVNECMDDLNRASEDMEKKCTDPAAFAEEIADEHIFFELKKGYAGEMVTGLIALDGVTIGVIGNRAQDPQKSYEAKLTAKGAAKAADFVRFCDAFDIPVLSLTNVKGYAAEIQEEKSLSKELARLVYALSEATVPKINFITAEAFGSAYVIMNSKAIGADLVYAFPDSKIGIMDAGLAAKMICEDNADIEKTRETFDKMQSGVVNAARRGYIDRIVSPADTRKYLIAGFEMLFTKRAEESYRKHGTK